jgi:hypothetical protein
MSTAKTAVANLADDFSAELAAICQDWLNSSPLNYSTNVAETRRCIDVAEGFVSAVRVARKSGMS